MPLQLELLQQELKSIVVSNQSATLNDTTSLVYPTKRGDRNKKNKPPPFYVSLIIGDKLVHNYMIDSGASSSVMPKCIANLLGIKYEPMVSDVLQLDGSSIKSIGVLKNV